MINTKTKGELGRRIEYDVEHDLFHPQNVYSDEYITPTFVEYVQKLEKENAELNNFIMQSKKDGISPINALIIKNLDNQLTKAREIIRKYYKYNPSCEYFYEDIDKEAEQFIKDSDIDGAIQQANEGLDFDKIADEMEQDLKDSEVEK